MGGVTWVEVDCIGRHGRGLCRQRWTGIGCPDRLGGEATPAQRPGPHPNHCVQLESLWVIRIFGVLWVNVFQDLASVDAAGVRRNQR